MATEPLVSAIIIFYNTQAFLAEAIESVLAQTCADWELLLCDDGSTDGSTEMARRFADAHPDKIKYLEHPGHQNRGMSAARNLGLRHARGKFVAWLDSDDVWLPNKLEVQLGLFDAHPEAAMVYGPSLFWYSWTGRPEDANRDFSRPPKMAIDALWQPPVLPISFLRDGTTVPGSVMFRREALLEVGGSEESFRDEFEDIAVYTKICLRRPAYASRRIVYKYRRHDQSCCALTHRLGRKQIRRLQFLKWLAKYLKKNGFQNTEVWNCVQEQLAPFRTLRYMASRCILHLRPIVRPCARLALPTSLYLRLRGDWVEQVSRDIP